MIEIIREENWDDAKEKSCQKISDRLGDRMLGREYT